MATAEEGTHKLSDGFEVYTKTWKLQAPRAKVLFVHGFDDHCNNYDKLFPHLLDRGIEIHSFDQRGWGRTVKSTSQRGQTGPTTTVHSDITDMLNTVLPSPETPVFLMGHSMGGAEVLTYGSQGPASTVSQLRGIISKAPLIALHPSTRPWRSTVLAGRAAGKLLPNFKLVQKLQPKWLSHDPEANKQWEEDPLSHHTGTLEGLAGMLDRAEQLETGNWTVKEGINEGGATRLLVLHGTDDHINLWTATRDYVDRLDGVVKDKKLLTYDGAYHNIHCEPNHQIKLADDVATWILDRVEIGAGGASQSKL